MPLDEDMIMRGIMVIAALSLVDVPDPIAGHTQTRPAICMIYDILPRTVLAHAHPYPNIRVHNPEDWCITLFPVSIHI